jgi:hypothetical protein
VGTEALTVILTAVGSYAWLLIARTADVITLVFGGLALWGFIFKRRQIAHIFRLAKSAHLYQRIENVRESLRALKDLNYDDKPSRREITALMGQICGQIGPLVETHPELKETHIKLTELVERKDNRRFSETVKRRICHQIDGILDNILFEAQSTTLGTKDV